MSKYELYELNIRLRSLAVFRALLDDPVIAALGRYLEAVDSAPMAEAVSKYAAFVSALYGT